MNSQLKRDGGSHVFPAQSGVIRLIPALSELAAVGRPGDLNAFVTSLPFAFASGCEAGTISSVDLYLFRNRTSQELGGEKSNPWNSFKWVSERKIRCRWSPGHVKYILRIWLGVSRPSWWLPSTLHHPARVATVIPTGWKKWFPLNARGFESEPSDLHVTTALELGRHSQKILD